MNLYIVTSQICNAKCDFCISRLKNNIITIEKKLYLNKLENILKKYKFTTFTIVGGEPLLFPYLEDTINLLNKYNKNIALTTNGILLNKNLDIKWLNISRHAISDLDSQKIFKNKKALSINKIQEYSKIYTLRINTCLMKSYINENNFYNYLDFLISNNIKNCLISELSNIDSSYITVQSVINYSNKERVLISDIDKSKLTFIDIVSDDYFTDTYYQYKTLIVILRKSDSTLKEKLIDSGKLYDLKFHSNGVLSKSWNPNKHIIE